MNGELPCTRMLDTLYSRPWSLAIYMGKPVGPRFGQNVTQNLGLVNFVPESCLLFVQISFIFRKMTAKAWRWCQRWLWKKWNTNFRLEHFVRKNRTTFSDVPLLSEICHWNDPTQKVVFHLTNRIFRKLFVNGKQLLFQNVILTLVSFVIAERNKGSRQISW